MFLSDVGSRAAIGLLPKERRLRSKADFDRVFRIGQVVKCPELRIIFAPGESRAGIGVARSVGSIARRNTVKRRWREALDEEMLPQKVDVVLIVLERGKALRGEKVAQTLRSLLKRIEP